MAWIIGMATGLLSGFISSTVIYIVTKRSEEKEKIYSYWIVYLFNAMKKCELWFPAEELLYIDKVGKKDSEWYRAVNEIIDLTKPFEIEDKVFDEKESKIAQNVLIAINELGKWYGIKKAQ